MTSEVTRVDSDVALSRIDMKPGDTVYVAPRRSTA